MRFILLHFIALSNFYQYASLRKPVRSLNLNNCELLYTFLLIVDFYMYTVYYFSAVWFTWTVSSGAVRLYASGGHWKWGVATEGRRGVVVGGLVGGVGGGGGVASVVVPDMKACGLRCAHSLISFVMLIIFSVTTMAWFGYNLDWKIVLFVYLFYCFYLLFV